MWDLILDPLVTMLVWLYSVLNNDVVLAIAVMTIIIRFLTYPLFAKQQASTRRMQAIQPKLKKIQEKYKDDKEKLAAAQMELYKEHGVNPFGGCLPLVIQFPILIGLYQAIFFALAATPFQLVDLSERLMLPGLDGLIPLQNTWLGMNLTQPPTPPSNPIYALALPLLVMGTTWYQSRLTMPSAKKNDDDDPDAKPDQAQAMTQSMTTIMPLMFGFFALSFSVGLSIYFIVSNLVGIAQYSPIGKRYLDPIFGGGGDVFIADDEEDADKAAKAKGKKASSAKAS